MNPPPPKQKKPKQPNQSNNELKSLINEYFCPYLHGPNAAKANLLKHTFGTLFADRQVVLPIFQRRYCWTETIVEKYMSDAFKGGAHSLEKLIFYVAPQTNDSNNNMKKYLKEPTLCCIDGQQRTTTTMLILISVRDLLSNSKIFPNNNSKADRLAKNIEKVLFIVKPKTNNNNDMIRGCRFIPTFLDRPTFFELIFGSTTTTTSTTTSTSTNSNNDNVSDDHILLRKQQIDQILLSRLSTIDDEDQKLTQLSVLCENLLASFQFFSYIIEDAKAGSAVYQWMQQPKMGDAIGNPHPGEPMAFVDLVRNYILSLVGSADHEWQENAYLNHWLPMEQRHTRVELDERFESMCGDDFEFKPPMLPSHVVLGRNMLMALERNQRLKHFADTVLSEKLAGVDDEKQTIIDWIDSI